MPALVGGAKKALARLRALYPSCTLIAIGLCIAFLFLYPQILKLAGLDHYLRPARSTAPFATASLMIPSTRSAWRSLMSGP